MRRVHLVEAAAEPGGSMRWISRLPGLGEWARVVNWRVIQLQNLANVEVICSARLDAGAVRSYGAELVVVATGAAWRRDGLSAYTHTPFAGFDDHSERLLTPEDVMVAGARPPGKRVVVYDGEGYFTAPGIAEQLATEGFRVELVTCLEQVAPVCDETLEGPLLRQRLHECGVTLRRGVTLTGIDDGGVTGTDEFGEALAIEADGVVLVTQRVSEDSLYRELTADTEALQAEGIVGLYRVGDCVAPRIPADAIFDGHRLGREIDSADPAIPLPYLRERATVS
jgi:dimethylamine/trimethylamine dehydrogenase